MPPIRHQVDEEAPLECVDRSVCRACELRQPRVVCGLLAPSSSPGARVTAGTPLLPWGRMWSRQASRDSSVPGESSTLRSIFHVWLQDAFELACWGVVAGMAPPQGPLTCSPGRGFRRSAWWPAAARWAILCCGYVSDVRCTNVICVFTSCEMPRTLLSYSFFGQIV